MEATAESLPEPPALAPSAPLDEEPIPDAEQAEGNSARDKELILEYIAIADMGTISIRSVQDAMQLKYNRTFDRTLVKDTVNEYMDERLADVAAAAPEEEEEEESESEEEEEESESEEEEEEVTFDFPTEWSDRFDDVVWVRTSTQWPWYPAIIINPLKTATNVQKKGLGFVGKKHTIRYYGDTIQFDFASMSQMRPYLEHREEFLAMIQETKKYSSHSKAVSAGVVFADEDVAKEKAERSNSAFAIHKVRRRRKREKRKQSSGPSASRAAKRLATSENLDNKIPKVVDIEGAGFTIPKPSRPPNTGAAAPQLVPKASKKSGGSSSAPVKKKHLSEPREQSEDEAEFDFEETGEEEDDEYSDSPKKSKPTGESRKRSREGDPAQDGSKPKKAKSAPKPKELSNKGNDKPKEGTKRSAPASKSKSLNKPPGKPMVSAASKASLEGETTEMRARRIVGLLTKCRNEESTSGVTPALKDKILKYMDKLQQMDLTLDELKNTQAAETIIQWRKHGDSDVSSKATTVRAVWKERVQKKANLALAAKQPLAPAASLDDYTAQKGAMESNARSNEEAVVEAMATAPKELAVEVPSSATPAVEPQQEVVIIDENDIKPSELEDGTMITAPAPAPSMQDAT